MRYKYILLSVLFIILTSEINSQGTSMQSGSFQKDNKLFINVSISPENTGILLNISENSLKDVRESWKMKISGSIEVGYMLSQNFGFSSGLRYSHFSTAFSLDAYNDEIHSVDSDLDNYIRIITGENINETEKISTLGIPLIFNMQTSPGEKFIIFFNPGIEVAIPVSKSYESTGTFSYKGYYPSYYITVENAGLEGFLDGQEVKSSGDLDLKSLFPEITANAGIQFKTGEKSRILFGINYKKAIADISGSSELNNFDLSTESQKINSLSGGSDKVSSSSIGLTIGLRYYIR